MVGSGSKVLSIASYRYCPKCVVEDRANFGETYWHREHHLVGVEICPKHNVWLEDTNIKFADMRLSQRLPCAEDEIPDRQPQSIDTNDATHNLQLLIAQEAIWLLNRNISSQLGEIRAKYGKIMEMKGYSRHKGYRRELRSEFIKIYGLDLLTHMGFDPNKLGWLNYIVQNRSNNLPSPLQHILFTHFLGQSVKSILETEFEVALVAQLKPFGDGPWECKNPICENYNKPSIITNSFRKYNHIDYPQTCIGTFLCSCGYTYTRLGYQNGMPPSEKIRRVVSYGELWDNKFIEMWNNEIFRLEDMIKIFSISGKQIKNAAKRLELPVPKPFAGNESYLENSSEYQVKIQSARRKWITTIEKFDCTTVNEVKALIPLDQKWLAHYDHEWYIDQTQGLKERKKQKLRSLWLSALNSHPGLIQKELFELLPHEAYWLKRHDKSWFDEHKPVRKSLSLGRRKELNEWANLDDATSQMMYEAASKAVTINPLERPRITLTSLCRMLNIPSNNIRNGKYPKTNGVIKEFYEPPVEFDLKKIKWAIRYFQEQKVIPTRQSFARKAKVQSVYLTDDEIGAAVKDALVILRHKI